MSSVWSGNSYSQCCGAGPFLTGSSSRYFFFTGSSSFSYKNWLKSSKKHVFAFTSFHRLRLRPKSTGSDRLRLRNTGVVDLDKENKGEKITILFQNSCVPLLFIIFFFKIFFDRKTVKTLFPVFFFFTKLIIVPVLCETALILIQISGSGSNF